MPIKYPSAPQPLRSFIQSYSHNGYRYSLCGGYDYRLGKARLFVSAATEATATLPSYIRSNAAAIYGVCVTDI